MGFWGRCDARDICSTRYISLVYRSLIPYVFVASLNRHDYLVLASSRGTLVSEPQVDTLGTSILLVSAACSGMYKNLRRCIESDDGINGCVFDSPLSFFREWYLALAFLSSELQPPSSSSAADTDTDNRRGRSCTCVCIRSSFG